MPNQSAPSPKPSTGGTIAALLGVSALVVAGISAQITANEGRVFKAYYDPAHVLTICDGDTTNVHVGEVDTPAQCDARRDRQLLAHAAPILQCTPGLKGQAYQLRAAINLGYNIGTGAYCGSTTAKLFNAGRPSWKAACGHMMDWSSASAAAPIKGAVSCKKLPSGRYLCVLPGLVKRRQQNVADCLKGL